MLATWLRPDERRGPLQDLIRALELTHLLLEFSHSCLIVGRDPDLCSVTYIGLAHPGPH